MDYSLVPDVAIVDPTFTMSMPPALTADTGVDALTHALEALVSIFASPYTDAFCLQAIHLILENLPRAYADGSGLAVSNAFVGVNHALARALGARFKVPQREALTRAAFADPSLRTNPRIPLLREFEALFDVAYAGTRRAEKHVKQPPPPGVITSASGGDVALVADGRLVRRARSCGVGGLLRTDSLRQEPIGARRLRPPCPPWRGEPRIHFARPRTSRTGSVSSVASGSAIPALRQRGARAQGVSRAASRRQRSPAGLRQWVLTAEGRPH